jgi:hypothetical protein
MRVSIIAIVLACFALSVSAEESSIDVQLGRTNQASVLPWMLSTPSMNKVVRRVVFTDVSQASLARELVARVHSVFWAAAEEAPQGAARLELAVRTASTFGDIFDRSLQLYNTLKNVKGLDVVVFKNGAAYMSLEGKQAGETLFFSVSNLFFPRWVRSWTRSAKECLPQEWHLRRRRWWCW